MTKENLKSLIETLNKRTRASEREELFQLVKFAFACPVLPEGECVISEAPDLIVHTSTGPSGIEHTRILRPLERAQEQLQDKVVDKAKALHDQRGGPMLWLNVDFNMHAVLSSKKVDELAVKLCDAVRIATNCREPRVAGEGWQNIEAWQVNLQYPNTFPLEISGVAFQYVDEPGFVLWGTGRGGVVPRLTIERIQLAIDAKEEKWESYKSKCSDLWLLLATSGGELSSYYKLPDDVAKHVYKSSFSRVFYHDSFSSAPIELKVHL